MKLKVSPTYFGASERACVHFSSGGRTCFLACSVIILSFPIFICPGHITNYELNARLGFSAYFFQVLHDCTMWATTRCPCNTSGCRKRRLCIFPCFKASTPHCIFYAVECHDRVSSCRFGTKCRVSYLLLPPMLPLLLPLPLPPLLLRLWSSSWDNTFTLYGLKY